MMFQKLSRFFVVLPVPLSRVFSRTMTLVLPLTVVASLTACVSSAPPKRPLDLPFTQVYLATYETVWNAVNSVLENYSVVRIERDAGIIETDWAQVRYNTALYEIPDKEEFLESVKSRIKIKLSKGLVAQSGQPAVRVQVVKELSEYKNFVLDYERVPTDTLEERVLLYRIGQRIRIAEALKRKSRGSKGGAMPGDPMVPGGDGSMGGQVGPMGPGSAPPATSAPGAAAGF